VLIDLVVPPRLEEDAIEAQIAYRLDGNVTDVGAEGERPAASAVALTAAGAHRQIELHLRLREVEHLRLEQVAAIERVAALTRDEARTLLLQRVEEEVRTEAGRRARVIEMDARQTAETQARKILSVAIQRYSSDMVGEITTTVVPIPNEEMKGRIIGREGRNIRALEAATGVDLIIDDTPDAVTLSCFDPVRREIARLALTKLVQDGRIHPARIEEIVAKSKQEIEQEIRKRAKRRPMRRSCPVSTLRSSRWWVG